MHLEEVHLEEIHLEEMHLEEMHLAPSRPTSLLPPFEESPYVTGSAWAGLARTRPDKDRLAARGQAPYDRIHSIRTGAQGQIE